jgi:hypothetical protein
MLLYAGNPCFPWEKPKSGTRKSEWVTGVGCPWPLLSRGLRSSSAPAILRKGPVVNLSKLAFRATGVAFVVIWLSNLAMTSLRFSSDEDLWDAAFQAKLEKSGEASLKSCRSQSVRESLRKRAEELDARTSGTRSGGDSIGKLHGRRMGNCTRSSKCSSPWAKGRPIQASKQGWSSGT